MQITFKLFATLTDYLPKDKCQGNEMPLVLAEGTKIAEVISSFNLPDKLVHLVLVNGRYVAPDDRAVTCLVEGDALAIWPPIAGG